MHQKGSWRVESVDPNIHFLDSLIDGMENVRIVLSVNSSPNMSQN